MANLTAPRNTAEYADLSTLTVTAGGTIYTGAMVALNASGEAVAAADSAGYKVIGRAENTVSSGGTVKVRQGCFGWDNDATSGCSKSDIGKLCYVKDDHTVAIAGTNNAVIAGVVKDVDADGVHVSKLTITAGGVMGAPSAAIADLTGAPTSANLNSILAALRKAGIIANS